MIRNLLACLLLLLPLPSLANQLSEAINQRMVQSETLRGEFSQQKQLALLPQPLRSNGRFLYSRQHGLLWHTQAPLENRVLFTQQGIDNLDQPQANPQGAGQQAAMRLFSQLFFALVSADIAQLSEHFEIDGENLAEQWRLQLTPKPGDVARAIQTLELRGDKQLHQVMFVDNNGDRTTIQFHNQQDYPLTGEELQHLAR